MLIHDCFLRLNHGDLEIELIQNMVDFPISVCCSGVMLYAFPRQENNVAVYMGPLPRVLEIFIIIISKPTSQIFFGGICISIAKI